MTDVSEVPSLGAANKGGRLVPIAGAVTAFLVTMAALFQAYTKAVDALAEAVSASRIATAASAVASAEPVAANGYQELAQRVEQLSTQQLAIHDDVVGMHGYLEGFSRGSGGPGTALRPSATRGSLSAPAPAVSALPSLTEAPKLVRARPVQEIRRMTATPAQP